MRKSVTDVSDCYTEDVVFMEDEVSKEFFFHYIEDVLMEYEDSRKQFWCSIGPTQNVIFTENEGSRENLAFYESRQYPVSVLAYYFWGNS